MEFTRGYGGERKMKQFQSFLKRSGRGSIILGGVVPVALLLSACASKPLNVAYDPANFGPPDPVEVVKAPETIGPGDKLRVTVFQEDSLSGDFQVEDNGQIDYPIIGLVEAQGMTPSELSRHISDRLREKALRKPDVQVALVERAQGTITIEGAVNQPGVVPIAGPTTLIQAVALARGTHEDADPSKVVVFRKVKGQRMAAAFDLRAIRRAEANDPTIYPNDIVVVSAGSNSKLLENVLRAIPILGIFRPF
jgi:polysaccharide biosynthesis/export protein